jgi:L-rhamnose isomerase
MPTSAQIEQSYALACERFAEHGVDADAAIAVLRAIPISIHCWQGDDVRGFEPGAEELGGGLAVTGSYPGRARNADELRSDFELALSLIPGSKRFSLHAIYAETNGVPVDRDALELAHFSRWIDWARDLAIGLDFNPTFFSHRLSRDGFTLSHPDRAVRDFWIRHGAACRRIGAAMGQALGSPCITNVWIPDGYKDVPFDRRAPRERLVESLDQVFSEPINGAHARDAVESKLFGLGSESYVVGSHEFYLGYAIHNQKILTLDAGHFHPTEVISDKLSAVLQWVDEILLHLSRGVRWDSDHVVILSDELRHTAQELVRGDYLDRVHIGLDYFDASVNRIAAWVIGARAAQQALLAAMLEPQEELRRAEHEADFTSRLATLEAAKQLPVGAVWDFYCLTTEAPVDGQWLKPLRHHERETLSRR